MPNKQRITQARMPVQIAVDRRPVNELTDEQLQRIIDLGRREAELIDELEKAVESGDRDLAWQISVAIYNESSRRE